MGKKTQKKMQNNTRRCKNGEEDTKEDVKMHKKTQKWGRRHKNGEKDANTGKKTKNTGDTHM